MSVSSAQAAMPAGRQVRQWTDEDKGIVRELFDQSYESVCRLAERFDVTPNAVTHLVSWMGLRILRRKRWSFREEERLEQLLSNHTIDETVKLSRRSYNSVMVRAKKLRLGKNHRDGWFTQAEVAEILGMSDKTVTRRVQMGALAAMPHDSSKFPRKGHSAPWHISREALIDYMRHYPEDLQGRNVSMVMLIDLLAGIKISYHQGDGEEEFGGSKVCA